MRTVIMKIKRLAQSVAKPITCQLPFFALCFIMCTSCAWMELRTLIDDWAWRPATLLSILRYMGLAWFYTYCATAIIHHTRSKGVKITFYTIAVAAFYVLWALRKVFVTNITPDIMLLAAETNTAEAGEFLQTYFLSRGNIIALTMTAAMIAVIIACERYYPKLTGKAQPSPGIATVLTMLVAMAATTIVIPLHMFACKTMPDIEQHFTKYGNSGIDIATQVMYSAHALHISSNEGKITVEKTIHEAHNGDARCTSADSISIIVVVGESYNKRHAGIYGYMLNTTPRLQQEVNRGNLFVFNDVISPYNTTSKTLKKVFSTCSAQHDQRWQDHPLLMAVFRHAGYDVVWWDNQLGREGKRSMFDFSLNSILFHPQLKRTCYTAHNDVSVPYDGDLIDDYVKSHIHRQSAKRLVVFHLLGQHVMARERYPNVEQWEQFTPDSVVNKASFIDDEARRLIAQYDNATRYNDAIVARITELFAHENAILIYFSDHGEEVFDYRYELGRSHSGNKDANYLHSQNDVPFMIWCSDKFIASQPQVVERISKAVNIPFMNTDLAQILFYLGDISTSYRHDTCNPLSPAFKPYHRITYDSIDYDIVVNNLRP